jgi:tRNA (guanine37-N1)-methyltransferase
MWQARIFTLYPEIFPGHLEKGLYGKALLNKTWSLDIVNLRDSAEDKHKTVDDTPFGGGTGMLMKADVLARSIDRNVNKNEKIFYLSPKGKLFDQKIAKSLSKENCVNLICGHFEGVDQRLLETRNIVF